MNRRRSSFVAVAVTAGMAILSFAIPAAASDASVAKALVITPADVGGGYVASPGQPTNPTIFGKLSMCVFGKTPKRPVTTFDGQQFTNAATRDLLTSSVDVVKSKAEFKYDLKLVKNAKFADCLKQVEQASLPAGATIVYVNMTSAPLLKPAFGSTFLGAFDVQVKVPSGGFVHIVIVAIGKGRAEVTAQLQSGSGSVNVSELTGPLSKVNQRLKKAKT